MGKFEDMGLEIGALTDEKNEAYGDSFEKSNIILHTLYPNGIKPEQYRDALAVTRVIDKLFRIATRKNAFGESPWKDIAGYGILGAVGDLDETIADRPERLSEDEWAESLPKVYDCEWPGEEDDEEPWEPKVGDWVRVKDSTDCYRGCKGQVIKVRDDGPLPILVRFDELKDQTNYTMSELEPLK